MDSATALEETQETAYTLAKRYYPDLWNINRLVNLVRMNLLTIAEYEEITGESYYSLESESQLEQTPDNEE